MALDRTRTVTPLRVGLAGVAGAMAGAILGGGIVGGLLWAESHPDPGGWGRLGALLWGLVAAVVVSYPGALVAMWLAVRGTRGDRRTIAWAALTYPVLAGTGIMSALGVTGVGPILGGLGVLAAGAAARSLALRTAGEADAPARPPTK